MKVLTARNELNAIVKHWLMWFILATQDIQLRYRRSTLGPFWITISMGVSVYCMGFLYGHLFKVDLHDYFPYLASGVIGWTYLSMLILECTNVFTESEGYIRNQESFMSIFVMRMLVRNSIIFLHNILVFVPIIFICHLGISWKTCMLIPGLLLLSINVITWGTVVGILGTRYRDFAQIVVSLVQVIFFLTPIMWLPSLLPERYQWLIELNPFYHFLNLIRAPLLNTLIPQASLLMVLGLTLVGLLLYALFLDRYKSRIVFWI